MLDRTMAPAASAVSRPNLPKTSQILLGGVPATILNQGAQPVILLELVFPVSRWTEPTAGLAYYVFKMLSEGTSKKSAEQIASGFDYYGSHLEIIPTLDHVSIKLYTLSKFLPVLLELLTELLTDSTFPSGEFELLKQIRLQQIKQQMARNNAFANLKFRELIFGKDHPYGLIISQEMAQAITLDEIVANKNMLLARPAVYVSGQITDADIKALDQAMSRIPFGDAPVVQHHPIVGGASESLVREDSTQASLRAGFLTSDRKHPDSHKMKVANTLFGGFFGSRLMKNIREEKGLTYGIHSSIMHLDHASMWTISSEVQRDQAELAKNEIRKELQRLATVVPSEMEFLMVVNYMKGKFLSSFDSPFSSHEMIKSLELAGLTEQYFHDFLNCLDTLTPEDISETTSKHFMHEMTELTVS